LASTNFIMPRVVESRRSDRDRSRKKKEKSKSSRSVITTKNRSGGREITLSKRKEKRKEIEKMPKVGYALGSRLFTMDGSLD